MPPPRATSVQLEQKMMQLMSRQAAERGDKGLAVLLKDIQYIRIIALKRVTAVGSSGMPRRLLPPTGSFSLPARENGQIHEVLYP